MEFRDSLDYTKSNDLGSRSHTIFTITLVERGNYGTTPNKATMYFVDLAGSERIAKTKTDSKKYQESILINSSLTTLGKVSTTCK